MLAEEAKVNPRPIRKATKLVYTVQLLASECQNNCAALPNFFGILECDVALIELARSQFTLHPARTSFFLPWGRVHEILAREEAHCQLRMGEPTN